MYRKIRPKEEVPYHEPPLGEDASASEDELPTSPLVPEHPAIPMAKRLGLVLDLESRSVTRHQEELELDPSLELADLTTIAQRAALWAEMLALRLSIDTTLASWSVEKERDETPEAVYQKHEIPSPYGDRYPRLVPRRVVERWESLQSQRAVVTAWEGGSDAMVVVYVMEVGRHMHLLSEADLGELGWEVSKVKHDAVRALFYQSYKVRPAANYETEHSRIRVYETREGLGNSRVLLLPDFDFDAARAKGFATTPSRDHLVVAQPLATDPEAIALTKVDLQKLADNIREHALYPLPSFVLKLDPEANLGL